MKLILRQKKIGKYIIEDENNKLLYMCNKKGLNYYINDENNLQLGVVKKNVFSKELYKIFMNGTVIDEVSIEKTKPIKSYKLVNKKWLISSDITYTTFEVKDENNKTILVMNNELGYDPYKWTVDLETTEKLLGIITSVVVLSISKKIGP